MTDTAINPYTGDYDLSNGALKRDVAGGLANAVYLRLMTPLGSYWGDALLGSRLHELQREKDLLRVSRLAQQYAEQALALLVSSGRAQSVSVEVQRLPGRLNLLVTVIVPTGQAATFTHSIKVAG